MFDFLKTLAGRGKGVNAREGSGSETEDMAAEDLPGVWTVKNGTLSPETPSTANPFPGNAAQKEDEMLGSKPNQQGKPDPAENSPGKSGSNGDGGPGATKPDVTALNQKVVQAVEFTNYENLSSASDMVTTPADMMVAQATGLVVQNAENYLNAIMQIAIAGQAVAIEQAAKGPLQAVEEIPLMKDIQNMVTEAAKVYKTISTDAGSSAQTVIQDLSSD